ncbi:hypothetical protein [Pseudomonas helleri]|uniref:hypothetical protein n=1 Tax=Pseudomonas helleri TaxID=1608996 RepID=UPI003F9816FA
MSPHLLTHFAAVMCEQHKGLEKVFDVVTRALQQLPLLRSGCGLSRAGVTWQPRRNIIRRRLYLSA